MHLGYVEYINNENKIIREKYWSGISEIDLSHKKIKEVTEIYGFFNVKVLDVSSNLLTTIMDLDKLPDLEILDLSDNKIRKIEGLDRLKKLELLYLNDNKIKEIEGLENLEQVCLVHLYNNMISEVKGFNKLGKLCEISLKNNQIKEVKTEQFIGLNRLQHIDLTANQLTDIKELAIVSDLRELFIRNNKIEHISITTLMKMPKLRLLYYDTDMIELPQMIERFLLRNMLKSRKSLKSRITTDNVGTYEQRCRKIHDMTVNQMFRDIEEDDEATKKIITYFESQELDNDIDESICMSIYELMDEPISITYEIMADEITKDKVLTNDVKKLLAQYCIMENIHTQLNLLFKELLLCVWNCLRSSKKAKQMKINMNEYIDAETCELYSGRIIQLICCLKVSDTKNTKKIVSVKSK